MIQRLISTLQTEVSGVAAKNYVAELAGFHRIQVSPGYRAAAHYVASTLHGFGLDARTLSYPSDGKATFWSMLSFLEWDCQLATLALLDDEGKPVQKLADYQESKISVIQRSSPVDGDFEVVVLTGGNERSDYEGLDVQGKVVLTDGQLDRVVELAVRQYGAAGVLYDGIRTVEPVRERIDLPDTRQYTSFWFRGEETFPVFGFVLTPRQGDALRKRCRDAAEKGSPPVRVRAKLDSSIGPGQMEVVTATLPGETREEVVLVAHLCHPQPSANDNASGSGALLEVARVLNACAQQGKLATPKRTIRLLWVPEMTGTYAYLASHEQDIPHMVGGLNLDMVGENQELCGSALLVEAPADSSSSFAPALARYIRDRLLDGASSHAGQGEFPLFRYGDTPFSGGSDHYILSDPTVGVPTPMIIQWPDRFYHTSDDTIDKVDPAMLATVGTLTATYAYWLANAGKPEAEWLGGEMTARFKRRVMEHVQQALDGALGEESEPISMPKLKRQISFWMGRHSEALATLRRLASLDVGPLQADAAAFVDHELSRVETRLGGAVEKPPTSEWEVKAASLVPSRRYRGPLSVRDLIVRPEDRETIYQLGRDFKGIFYTMATLAIYWVDGERTVSDIADLVELETGKRQTEALVRLFEFLSHIGGIDLRPKAGK